jgi:hypothetical protein
MESIPPFYSSFGKFVELQFDKTGRISRIVVRTYLLERSCVCQVLDPERNYHCFYLLCVAPPEVCYHLSDTLYGQCFPILVQDLVTWCNVGSIHHIYSFDLNIIIQ